MDKQIKQRAKDIVQSDLPTMLIATSIFTLVSYGASCITGNIVASIVSAFITAVVTACSACFYFRAYNRGHGDVKDIYRILTDKDNIAKIASIMLTMWIIHTLLGVAALFAAVIPLVGLIVILVATVMVFYLLRMVWFLFIANPQYSVDYYFKGSCTYMGHVIISFFVFTVSVSIVPAIIELLITTLAGATIANLVCIPLNAYVDLALAGYLSSIIPNEWFDGTARV